MDESMDVIITLYRRKKLLPALEPLKARQVRVTKREVRAVAECGPRLMERLKSAIDNDAVTIM
jgi:hypothetical protein